MPVNRKIDNDQMNKPFLEKGAEVICPNCKKFQARVTQNIPYGTGLKSSMFEGPAIKKGAPMKCVECGMPWFLVATGQIHLKGGWFPKSS
jgi:uncharacterized Zn finger protein (UPF0148 family)